MASDIRAHLWKRDPTDRFRGENGTRYLCSGCGYCFVHLYDLIPDIFTAMSNENVPATCAGHDREAAEAYAQENRRLRTALEAIAEWDMLTLNSNGSGAATHDAPAIRKMIATALGQEVTDGE